MYRVRMGAERTKLRKEVNRRTESIFKKFPQSRENKLFVEEYVKKKLGYQRPIPYHDLIRKPLPNEVKKEFKEKLENGQKEEYYDEKF